MPANQSLYRLVFLTGVGVFVLGSGPLLLVIALAKLGVTSDPNPNPVFFGLMAMFTFWPGIGTAAVGLILWIMERRKERLVGKHGAST